MDYRDYQTLMEHYIELGKLSIDQKDTKESLIQKLIGVSHEKKQIWNDTNAIIREYIVKFEKEPELLDGEAAAMLEDFLLQLNPADRDFLDPSISLRIARLLLRYYQAADDPEQIIRILEQCAYYDLTIKEHRNDYETTPYAIMAEPYMGQLDSLSQDAIRRLVRCLTLGGYNKKDLAFSLQKYKENKETFAYIYEKAGKDDLAIQQYYAMFKSNALGFALLGCLTAEAAMNRGITLSEPPVDLAQYGSVIDEFSQELKGILASDRAESLLSDRIAIKFNIAQADYHMGRITLNELLALMEEYLQPQADYTPYEHVSALLTGWPCYLDYFCKCGKYDRQYVQNRSIQVIEHVLTNTGEVTKELSQYYTTYLSNRAVLDMISTASGFLEFDFFKRTVLDVTVYANKELYVHTMMVREIALTLLHYILDHDPRYLDGVAGYSWEYCRDHKQEIMDLMENCALLHDIGKFFCLDIVNNSSRSLTDDEFDIIKEHPTNFSKVYQGGMSPQLECIRDCAELHHLWYDESGGYPRRKHTANKPFVDILTIADCLDAATDNIGRPYGLGKTLVQVMAEFDDARNTRYSGYICQLLHVEEVRRMINYVIRDKREDIYRDIYLQNI